MPEFSPHKKRQSFDSVDGIISRRIPKTVTHSNYRRQQLNKGPRQPVRSADMAQASRRRPHISDPSDPDSISKESAPLVGNFSASTENIFDDDFMDRHHKPAEENIDDGKKKKKKDRKGLRGWWHRRSLKFKFGLISILIVLVGGGLLGYRLYSFLSSVFANGVGNSSSAALNDQIKPEHLNTEGDGRLNILLMGRGGDENVAPDLTDTMIIASIDLQNQSTTLLSVPRDMWVTVNGSSMKINAAYSTGKQYAQFQKKSNADAEKAGVQSAINAMRNVTGVPIHKYVLTDYKAFRDIVNALGGVDVNVDTAIYDTFTGWKFKAGPQTMNGDTALKFARSRHGSPRGDFDRNQHQRQLLVGMRKKATSTGIVANPVRLNSLANAVQKNIRTDLSLDEAKTLFSKTKGIPDSAIVNLDLAKPSGPLVTTGSASGISIVRPLAGLADFTDIRDYARTNMIDPFLKKESPTIAVYNASGRAGLASTVGVVMAGYGYKVLTKETSASLQQKTLVVKKTSSDKPFTNRFLSVRFNTTITGSLPSNVIPAKTTSTTSSTASSSTTTQQPDYIIVLGTDFKTPSGFTW